MGYACVYRTPVLTGEAKPRFQGGSVKRYKYTALVFIIFVLAVVAIAARYGAWS